MGLVLNQQTNFYQFCEQVKFYKCTLTTSRILHVDEYLHIVLDWGAQSVSRRSISLQTKPRSNTTEPAK